MRFLFLLMVFPALAVAQTSTATAKTDDSGYVVKVDSADVYVDFGEKSGAHVGQRFMIYKEGEALIHPVDGRPLGRMEMQIAEGSLRDIHSGYSVGSVKRFFGKVGSGMRVRLSPEKTSAEEAAAPATARAKPASPEETETRAPRLKGAVLDYAAHGLAVADLRGDGVPLAAVAGEKEVFVYPYPVAQAKPATRLEIKGNNVNILSVEAADLNANGRAELFVSFFNAAFNRVETAVLEMDESGALAQTAEMPWIVRARQDGRGRPALLAQQLHEDRTFPFSSFYSLVFKDGRYARGGKLPYRGVDWIYAFGTADFDGTGETVLEITSTDRLRLNFKKGHWRTQEAFGATPVRFTWGGQILECHPAMPVRYTDKGFDALYAVKNIGGLGGLADRFGRFVGAELHRLEFSGLGLSSAWKSKLDGYVPAVVLVPGGKDVAMAVVGTQGKSAVWVYDP